MKECKKKISADGCMFIGCDAITRPIKMKKEYSIPDGLQEGLCIQGLLGFARNMMDKRLHNWARLLLHFHWLRQRQGGFVCACCWDGAERGNKRILVVLRTMTNAYQYAFEYMYICMHAW